MPISSVVEEFKTGKARLVMTLKDSKDEKVRGQESGYRRGASGRQPAQ